MPRPLYPLGKSPRYQLDTRPGGIQSRSGRKGEVKILAPSGLKLRTFDPPALSQPLYRLRYPSSLWKHVFLRNFFGLRQDCTELEPRRLYFPLSACWEPEMKSVLIFCHMSSEQWVPLLNAHQENSISDNTALPCNLVRRLHMNRAQDIPSSRRRE
jgi:hypothetical protein